MLDYLLRFLVGGIAVSAFAALGNALRPKTFAGLFGAAPSIALATLLIALSQSGAPFVAVEARSMILGAWRWPTTAGPCAFFCGNTTCRHWPQPWELLSSGLWRRSGFWRS